MAEDQYTPETWRVIMDAPNYAISDTGRVVRIRAQRPGNIGRTSKPWLSKDGYWMVSLLLDGNTRATAFQLHRLICKAFHGPPPSASHQVAHNNGVRTDNRPDNLRWATSKENNADRVRHKTDPVGERNPRAKLSENDILAIRGEPKTRGVRKRLAQKYGVTRQTIYHIMEGKTWQHVSSGVGVGEHSPTQYDIHG